MRITPFALERWQSTWENRVSINISESGVHPLTARELAGDALDAILATPLGYPQTNGSDALRTNVARLYPGATAANVLVTCGCSEANFLVAWSLLERGDEVVFMQPNYMQVAGVAESFGVEVKPLWLREDLRWAPDTDELRRLVTPRTKLIAICNPNNPTGAVLSARAIRDICAIAAHAGAWILADEVYRGAEFVGGLDREDAPLAPTFWDNYERVLCTGGLSKAYALPGLRTGWVVGPPATIEQLWGYHDYTSIGPTMLGDRLAALALEPRRRTQILQRTRRIIRENYPVVERWVASHPDLLTHIPPSAGAIAWVRYALDISSDAFVEELRAKKDVLLVPGSQFGMEGYLRIGFGGDAAQLGKALDRMDEMMAAMPAPAGAVGARR